MNLFPRTRSNAVPETGTIVPGSPDAVEVDRRSVRVGDGYTAALAVTGYPAEVGPGWLEPLLAYPGRVDVSLHIEPVPPVIASQRLRKQRGRFEASRRQDAAKGRLDDPELDAAAADAAELAARVARGEARLFRLGLYLTVHADSEDELADRVAEIRALASSLLLDVAPATWRQLQGWITGLPLAFDALGMKRVFDTDAVAAGFPFTSPDLPTTAGDTGMGVLYGLNLHSPGVVVWDRWAQSNYNSVILARSGEGKSYLAKLDLLRNLYLGPSTTSIPGAHGLKTSHAVSRRSPRGTASTAGRPERAVCAVVAGYRSYTAIAEWVDDIPAATALTPESILTAGRLKRSSAGCCKRWTQTCSPRRSATGSPLEPRPRHRRRDERSRSTARHCGARAPATRPPGM